MAYLGAMVGFEAKASKAAQHIADFPKFILAMPSGIGDIPDLIGSCVLF